MRSLYSSAACHGLMTGPNNSTKHGRVPSTRDMSGQVAFIQQSSKQKKATTYQSLLAYGREVFQLCLGTVLTGASLSSNADLAAKLNRQLGTVRDRVPTLNDDSIPLAMRLETDWSTGERDQPVPVCLRHRAYHACDVGRLSRRGESYARVPPRHRRGLRNALAAD